MGIIKLSGKRGEILGGGGEGKNLKCTDTIIPSSTPNRTVSASGLKSRLPLALLADD